MNSASSLSILDPTDQSFNKLRAQLHNQSWYSSRQDANPSANTLFISPVLICHYHREFPVPNFTIPVPCCPYVICDSQNNNSAGCTARSYVSRPSRKTLLKTSFHPAGCEWRQWHCQVCRRMVRQFHNRVQYAPPIRPKAGQSGFQLRAGHCTRYP